MAAKWDRKNSLRSYTIPAHLQQHGLALRWPEDNRRPLIPFVCDVWLDAEGFYLVCLNKATKTAECFDIALIHDTRTGSHVSLPGSPDDLKKHNIGTPDVSIQSKWLTIYYGETFSMTDLRAIHFLFPSPDIAQEWAERLFHYSHCQNSKNLSSLACLEKIYSRIINGLTDFDKEKIPIQSLVNFLCKNARDSKKRNRILQILRNLELPSELKGMMDRTEFTFNKFFHLYMQLMQCHDVEKLFKTKAGKDRQYIDREGFKKFLETQNNSIDGASGIGTEYYKEKINDLVRKYADPSENAGEPEISIESFLKYLLSSDNFIIDTSKLTLCMDMDKPLAHYFISSSHNTYLPGHQWTGRASIEMYIQVLLTGCRCIELDVLDSERHDEPEIRHKNTPVKPVSFIEVIVAIKDYAFKVTPYPLILSIENHCSPNVQKKMAQYFIDIFGSHLITKPLKTHPCEENYPLPSPNDLKYKVLIKNKKLSTRVNSDGNSRKGQTSSCKPSAVSATSSSDKSADESTYLPSPTSPCSTKEDPSEKGFREPYSPVGSTGNVLDRNPRHCIFMDDDSSSDECQESGSCVNQMSNVDVLRESKATKAMSDLVIYVVPMRFKGFAYAAERNRSFEMSSFSEERALTLVRDQAKEFLDYNQQHLTRIYPRGTRIDSSNYNPYLFWPIGCQMCALNYQTLDVPMQLNLGLFSLNNACGYIEKPAALCQFKGTFDPKTRMNIENIVALDLYIQVISGQFLCQDREPTIVNIQVYGLYGDSNKRQEYTVRLKGWNGFQAIYNNIDINSNRNPIHIPKITLPEMAAIRLAVSTDDGTCIGQSFIPVAYLRSGIHYVVLKNSINVPIISATLLVLFRINIHTNAEDQTLINRLLDPLNGYPLNMISESCLNVLEDPYQKMLEPNEVASSNEIRWYQKHLIAASRLHDKKNLCRVLSYDDIVANGLSKQQQINSSKLRRISEDYQKKIEKENDRLDKTLKSQSRQMNDRRTSLNSMSESANQSQSTNTARQQDIEATKQRLIHLHSQQLNRQQELEFNNINEYYEGVKRLIYDDYDKKMKQIDYILQQEKSRVNEEVQSQIKREEAESSRSATNQNDVFLLKQQAFQDNLRAGESTIQVLEDMRAKVKEALESNLKMNLEQVEKRRHEDITDMITKYRDQLNDRLSKLNLESFGDRNQVYNSVAVLTQIFRTSTNTSLSNSPDTTAEMTKKDSEPT